MTASHTADLSLVRRVLAKDADAIEAFGQRMACVGRMLSARNRTFGSILTGDELEDVAQDVVTRVLAKLATYSGLAAMESWVYVFCEGELRNAIRRKRRRAARDKVVGAEPVQALAAVPEFGEDVQLCVGALPLDDQQLVRWKHFEDLALEAISDRTASKLNTTKSRYYRVLLALRACLERRARGNER